MKGYHEYKSEKIGGEILQAKIWIVLDEVRLCRYGLASESVILVAMVNGQLCDETVGSLQLE